LSLVLYVVLPIFLLLALIAFNIVPDPVVFHIGPLGVTFEQFMALWAVMMAAVSVRGGGGRRR